MEREDARIWMLHREKDPNPGTWYVSCEKWVVSEGRVYSAGLNKGSACVLYVSSVVRMLLFVLGGQLGIEDSIGGGKKTTGR